MIDMAWRGEQVSRRNGCWLQGCREGKHAIGLICMGDDKQMAKWPAPPATRRAVTSPATLRSRPAPSLSCSISPVRNATQPAMPMPCMHTGHARRTVPCVPSFNAGTHYSCCICQHHRHLYILVYHCEFSFSPLVVTPEQRQK